MDNSIKFSIIIPAYNAESYIADAIKSITGQDYESYEIIIVNDHSTDHTSSIVSSQCQKNDRIRAVNLTRGRGVSDARNLGITLATGDYILFVDADDYYISKYLLYSLSEAIKAHDYDIIHFGYIESSIRNTQFCHEIAKPKPQIIDADYDDIVKRTVFMLPQEFNDRRMRAASPWTKAYRAAFLKSNNIFFPSAVRNSEDAIFNLRSLSCHPTIGILDTKAYFYWSNPTNSSQRYMPEFKDEVLELMEIFKQETEPFNSIPGISERVNLRMFSYIYKVIRQYYCHPENAYNKKELQTFINNPNITSISKALRFNYLPVSFWPVKIGLTHKSPGIIANGIKFGMALQNIKRKF